MKKKEKPEQRKSVQPPAELSDEELSQVAGGTKWELSEYDALKLGITAKRNIKANNIKGEIEVTDFIKG